MVGETGYSIFECLNECHTEGGQVPLYLNPVNRTIMDLSYRKVDCKLSKKKSLKEQFVKPIQKDRGFPFI